MLLARPTRSASRSPSFRSCGCLPLAIYLLSFVICFDNQRWYRRGIFHPALGAAVFMALVVLCSSDGDIASQIVTYSALLFAICMVCHGELVKLKPHERYLTSFYLMVAIGGALGGVFVVVLRRGSSPAIGNSISQSGRAF